jgi:condensin complex subunit 2
MWLQARCAKHAKHVDVLNLKSGVWRELERAELEQAASATDSMDGHELPGVHFQDIVHGLQQGDGGRLPDLTVHLCFICLLHLANEKTLLVKGTSEMDELRVWREQAVS